MRKTTSEGPHAVDKHVGELVRVRRVALGLSQSDLAKALGLTFQQVQKYEKGTNRISASKLFDTATFLKVPISFFFEGLPEAGTEGAVETGIIHTILCDREGLDFLRAYAALGAEHKTTLRNVAQGFIK